MLGIEAIGQYIPVGRISNYERQEQFGIDAAFIEDKIGFRAVARKAPGEETSDLCVRAFYALQKRSGLLASDVECLVVVTQTPDFSIPHVSAIVHGTLGLPERCACFDISLGCSGFVYGLSVVQAFMAANGFTRGVLITADPYSKVVNDADKNTTLLFGDAAAATLISDRPVYVSGAFSFGTDGNDWDKLTTKDGQLYMHGRAVFNFAAKRIPVDIARVLEVNGVALESVDRVLLHQGSQIIVRTIAEKLGLNSTQVPFLACDYGNSCASTIPLLIEGLFDDPSVRRLVLSGFGVGLSWASTVLHRVH